MSTLSLHDALPISIVVYGLAVAALVMTGAKLGQRIGWALIFRCVLGVFAASSLAMILSRTVTWAIIGQLLAGAAAAIIVDRKSVVEGQGVEGGGRHISGEETR